MSLNAGGIRNFWRAIWLSSFSGLLAGLSSTAFLYLLDFATRTRQANVWLLAGLPLVGFAIGYGYHRFGKVPIDVARGNNLVIDEIHDPKKTIPLRIVPLVFFGTILTHLFGGSAGREGTAVQMGAGLSDAVAVKFQVSPSERRILLMTGAGAGFAAAIGAPIAGLVFGMEVIRVGRFKLDAILQCSIAAFIAFGTTLLLQAPHSKYPRFEIPALSLDVLKSVLPSILIAGIAFGLAARLFVLLTHAVEKSFVKIKYPPSKPFIGGLMVLGLYGLVGNLRYAGLGIETIQSSLLESASFLDPLYKAVATALTIGSGFKGGEFIPLVFIGTTLGSALAILLPASLQLLGALGFSSVFGAAANTPLACAVMACEIFGWQIAPYALICGFVAYALSGRKGIYPAQIRDT